MTVDDLIRTLLDAICRQFYGQARVREFLRDRKSLMQAIARYGYECSERGWRFEPVEIQEDVLAILQSMEARKAEIEWLPRYLEGAVDRHIRLRAEELSARAKAADQAVQKAMRSVPTPVAGHAPSATTTLAQLYRSFQTGRPKKAAGPKQIDLL